MATHNLFLSHSWSYSGAYEGLVGLLDNQVSTKNNGFNYKNYSVPKDDPIHNANNAKELKAAIEKQIRPCSSVLILAGVYSTYSKWINVEIGIAQALGKKIIAIEPWGAEKTSTVVKDAADYVVGWRGKSIVDAIEATK